MPTAAAAAAGVGGAGGGSGRGGPHHSSTALSPSSDGGGGSDEGAEQSVFNLATLILNVFPCPPLGTLAGVLVVAFLGAVIISIMVYYRCHRRFKRLKTELAHVHYIPDPSSAAAAAGNQGARYMFLMTQLDLVVKPSKH